MSNYNKVLLMGRLTRDPELRYTPQGTPVSEIGLAVNREYTVGTERRKETTFVDITLWRKQAEVVCQYLRKGAPIFIEGHLALDTWEGQDGQKRSRLRVIAETFQFLGSRSEGESGRGSGQDEFSQVERPYTSGRGRPSGDRGPEDAKRPGAAAGRIPPSAFSAVPGDEPRDAGAGEPRNAPDENLGIDDSEIPF
jgi:single-strand DNA-binding protein